MHVSHFLNLSRLSFVIRKSIISLQYMCEIVKPITRWLSSADPGGTFCVIYCVNWGQKYTEVKKWPLMYFKIDLKIIVLMPYT